MWQIFSVACNTYYTQSATFFFYFDFAAYHSWNFEVVCGKYYFVSDSLTNNVSANLSEQYHFIVKVVYSRRQFCTTVNMFANLLLWHTLMLMHDYFLYNKHSKHNRLQKKLV